MGYRSEVDIVFYVPSDSDTAYGLLKLWFDENYPHTEAEVCGAEITYDPDNRAIALTYTDIKWYDGYEHPQAVEKAFEDIDELINNQLLTPVKENTDPNVTPFNIAWEFTRLGEEDNDTEMRASENAEYVIALNRSTEITFSQRNPT